MNTNYFDCIRKSIIDARGSVFDLQWVPLSMGYKYI